MNSIVTLAIVYGMMTLGSAGVLYFSFRGKLDLSAKYFLLAEMLMLISMPMVALQNIYPEFEHPISLWTTNFLFLFSEISVLFSLYCLTRKIKIQYYYFGLLLTVTLCTFIEFCRLEINPKLPYLILNIPATGLAFGAYYLCKHSENIALRNHLFVRWIAWLEFGLGCFALVRLFSYFSEAPIGPRHPTTIITLLYTTHVVLSVFRYISYQSLRISWIDPRTPESNLLNRNLVAVVEEKNQLLQGLIASNRVIGISALASSLAHQLSQPLTAIAIRADTAKRELAKINQNTTLSASLDDIRLHSGKLAALVQNLRQLFNTKTAQFHEENLQKAVDEVIELVEPTLQAKGISLEKNYQSNPLIFGDAIQIQQVLINILNNAIDVITAIDAIATSTAGKPTLRIIRVGIAQNEQFAILTVQDSGVGIAPNQLVVEYAFKQAPHIVCMGNEYLHQIYHEDGHGDLYNDSVGHRFIHQYIRNIATHWNNGTMIYRTQTIAYSMAKFGSMMKHGEVQINLDTITSINDINEPLHHQLSKIVNSVNYAITQFSMNDSMASEWVKSNQCWELIKEIKVT